jgi:hypothetical protein
MIVKIIRGSIITWVDCQRAEWVPATIDKDPEQKTVMVTMDNENEQRKIEQVECVHGNGVYFMSNSGQTFDALHW